MCIRDSIVGEEHGEGFVADEFTGHEDGVAEAEGFSLANVGDIDHVGDGAHDLQQIGLAALFEHAFELVADIEMVFDRLFAAAGDDEDLVAARSHGFFDSVLDDGLIDQREHFLGLGFGCGQKAGAEAGGGEYGFANFHLLHKGGRWSVVLRRCFVRVRVLDNCKCWGLWLAIQDAA